MKENGSNAHEEGIQVDRLKAIDDCAKHECRGILLSLYPGAHLPLYLFNARRLPDGRIVAAKVAGKADQRKRVNDPLGGSKLYH